jgi:nucleoside-diphosphate-sugar epimerase
MGKLLITGGAGYIGSVLTRQLLKKNYKVKVLDNLLFGGESIIELLNDENFEFIKGDICDESILRETLKDVEAVVNLAAIVGDPACAKDPEKSNRTNIEGAKLIYKIANDQGVNKFIMASTCSNYGKMANPEQYVNEQSELAPVSLYAETKVAMETFLLSQNRKNVCKPTCLRFATAYGLSPRMRFDLTVNEFTKDLALGKELVVFGGQFWRPYCHVTDIARSIIIILESEQNLVEFNIFNIGDTSENYQKLKIVSEIKKQLPGSRVKFVKRHEDPRDYRVSFQKVQTELGFHISKTVPDGIKQIITLISNGLLINPDDNRYKNS